MQFYLVTDTLGPDATEGHFEGLGQLKLYTIEQPWNGNAPEHSCVPRGYDYQLIPYFSPKHQIWTWCLHNPQAGIYAFPSGVDSPYAAPAGVVSRSVCEIHPANWAFELEGCIAPGLARGRLDPKVQFPDDTRGMLPAVLSSVAAFKVLCEHLAPDGVSQATGHVLSVR